MFNIKQIFKKEKCSICNKTYYMGALHSKEEKYVCNYCEKTFNKLNDVSSYYNKDLFEKSSYNDIYNSVIQRKSIHSINYDNKLKQASIQKQLIKQQRSEYYNTLYRSLNYRELKLSDIPTPKKLLKDIVNFKTSPVTLKTSDLKLDNFVVIDTETTGLSATKDEILEIAAIKFIEGQPSECLTTLIKPKKEISTEIININHITNEMVLNAPNISFVIEDFYDFIDNYNIVAYNTEFDVKFLYKNGLDLFAKKRQFYDAIQICKKYYKDSYLDNYKLDTICKEYGINRTQKHRAVEDALATGIIFNDLSHKLKNS